MSRLARHDTDISATDSNHLAVRLVIVSEIVLLRFAIDNIEKELLELIVSRTGPKRLHNVELKIAAKTWTQFPVTCEPKFVAAFAKMQVCHCPDKANALSAAGDLVVRGRSVRPKFGLRV